jgi:NAD(P)-dependent dehydrogenase (short-subunit alcohol dehydrogenase family)
MTNTLIIAGNRGIGFALVNEIVSGLILNTQGRCADAQAAQDPSGTIFATTRNPSDSAELNEVASKSNGKIIVVKCDMIDEESVKVLKSCCL